jgi:hypothetical protein
MCGPQVTGELSVRFTPRAAIAAVMTITAAVAAVLPFSAPALAGPVPPAPNPSLIGTWANVSGFRNILDIVISRSGTGILVDAFENCAPTVCEHGDVTGTLFGASVSSETGNSFQASWISGRRYGILLGTLDPKRKIPTLTVQEFTIDNSGLRANHTYTETFRPRKPITPTRVGTPATRYTVGDSLPPGNTLIGAWVNRSPASSGIARLVLSRSGPRGATLVVHAFGKCPAEPCDRGKVDGITFGIEGKHSVVGRVFLAQYESRSAEELLDGTASTAGTVLTVEIYTQFTGSSGRSNHLVTETFRRADTTPLTG